VKLFLFKLLSSERKVDLILSKMKFMKLGSKPDTFQADANNNVR
jgi:hypothetical protein